MHTVKVHLTSAVVLFTRIISFNLKMKLISASKRLFLINSFQTKGPLPSMLMQVNNQERKKDALKLELSIFSDILWGLRHSSGDDQPQQFQGSWLIHILLQHVRVLWAKTKQLLSFWEASFFVGYFHEPNAACMGRRESTPRTDGSG